MCNGQTAASPQNGNRRFGDHLTPPKVDLSDLKEEDLEVAGLKEGSTSTTATPRSDLGDEVTTRNCTGGEWFPSPLPRLDRSEARSRTWASNPAPKKLAWNEKEGCRSSRSSRAPIRQAPGIQPKKAEVPDADADDEHALWFGSSTCNPELGKLMAYRSSPIQSGMSKPPQNPAVQRDLLKYLQSTGQTRSVPPMNACVKALQPIRGRCEQRQQQEQEQEHQQQRPLVVDSGGQELCEYVEGSFPTIGSGTPRDRLDSARSQRGAQLMWSPSVTMNPLPWNRPGCQLASEQESDNFKGLADTARLTSETAFGSSRRRRQTVRSQPAKTGFDLLSTKKPKPVLNDQQLHQSLTTLRQKSLHHGLDQDKQEVEETHDLRVYHNNLVRTGTASSTREKGFGMSTPRQSTYGTPLRSHRLGTPLRSSTPGPSQEDAASSLRGLRQILEDNMRSPKIRSAMEQELRQVHEGIKKIQEPLDAGISPKRRSLQRLRTSVRIAAHTAPRSDKPPLPGGFLKTVNSAVNQKEVLQGAKTYFECPWLRSGATTEDLKFKVTSPPGKMRIRHDLF